MRSLLALLLLAAPLAAQTPGSLGPVVASTRPGTLVRAELGDGSRVTGALGGADASSFTLAPDSTGVVTVRFDDTRRFWRRGRAVGTGAIAGGAIGAATGAFLGMLVHAICEYDCSGSEAGAAVVGGLLVGGIGAGAGAIIGAAFPRWKEVWRGTPLRAAPEAGTAAGASPLVRARRIGELTVQAVGGAGGYPAYAGFPGDAGAMGGAAVSLGFRAGRVGFGPDVQLLAGPSSLRSLSGTLRVDLGGSGGRAVPYAIGGLGGYVWSSNGGSTSVLTGTLGGGVTLNGAWRVEARWHRNLQNIGGPAPNLVTLSAGRVLAW